MPTRRPSLRTRMIRRPLRRSAAGLQPTTTTPPGTTPPSGGRTPGPQSGRRTPQNPQGLPTYLEASGREMFDFSGSDNQRQQTGWAAWLRELGRLHPELRGQRVNVMDYYNQLAASQGISPHPDYTGVASTRDGRNFIGDQEFIGARFAGDPAWQSYWMRYIPTDDNDVGAGDFGPGPAGAPPPTTTTTTPPPGTTAPPPSTNPLTQPTTPPATTPADLQEGSATGEGGAAGGRQMGQSTGEGGIASAPTAGRTLPTTAGEIEGTAPTNIQASTASPGSKGISYGDTNANTNNFARRPRGYAMGGRIMPGATQRQALKGGGSPMGVLAGSEAVAGQSFTPTGMQGRGTYGMGTDGPAAAMAGEMTAGLQAPPGAALSPLARSVRGALTMGTAVGEGGIAGGGRMPAGGWTSALSTPEGIADEGGAEQLKPARVDMTMGGAEGEGGIASGIPPHVARWIDMLSGVGQGDGADPTRMRMGSATGEGGAGSGPVRMNLRDALEAVLARSGGMGRELSQAQMVEAIREALASQMAERNVIDVEPLAETRRAPPMSRAGLQRSRRERALRGQFADGGRVGYASGGGVPPITYQDYLRLNTQGQGSEATSPPMSEAQWNALPLAARWSLLGDALWIEPTDPRYAQFESIVNPNDRRNILLANRGLGDFLAPNPRTGRSWVVDPNRVMSGEGWQAIPWDNASPEMQDQGDNIERLLAIAAAMMGGVGYLGATGAFGAEVGGNALAAAGGQGFGTALGGGAEALGGAGLSGAGSGLSLMENITPVQLQELSQLPAIQQAAAGAGQGVMQWLTNPRNLLQVARLAGPLLSGMGAGGGGGQVPLLPPPGGGETVGPPSGPPGGGALTTTGGGFTPRPLPASLSGSSLGGEVTGEGGGIPADVQSLLDALDPANFAGGPATFERWDAARGRFQPLEDMLFDEAMKAGGAEEQEAAAGRAGADVTQKFDQAKRAQRARLIAQGINPDEGRGPGTELDRIAMLDEAKASAGSKNLARLAEKEKGFDRRARAAGLGAQLAGQALSADTAGLQYEQGNRRLMADLAGRRADLGSRLYDSAADRRLRGRISDLDRDARLYTSDADRDARIYDIDTRSRLDRERLGYQDRWEGSRNELERQRINSGIEDRNYTRDRQRRQDQGAGFESIVRGLGSLYDLGDSSGFFDWVGSFFADGGRVASKVGLGTKMPMHGEHHGKKKRPRYQDGARVRVERNYDAGGPVSGPGTSTSDSIRARLSDGEHVLNAEAVELLDIENPGMLDELNEQGLKIRAVREALERGMSEVGLGS